MVNFVNTVIEGLDGVPLFIRWTAKKINGGLDKLASCLVDASTDIFKPALLGFGVIIAALVSVGLIAFAFSLAMGH